MWEGEYKLNAVLIMNDMSIYNPKQHSKVLHHITMEIIHFLEWSKKIVKLDKPTYAGFTILDLSKLHMYDFHYTVMKPPQSMGIIYNY